MIDWNKVIVSSDDDTVQVVCGKSIFFAVSRAAGIDRVRKTSTSGLVDTYTMYRTDGTVAGTFTVTNGRVAEIHICSSYEYDSQTLIPTIANPQTNTFYLVPSGTGNDMYDEWIYVNNAWEKFGSASVDLSQYYTKNQTDELLNTKANTNDLGSMAFEDDAPTDNVEYVRKNGEWAVSSGGGGSGGQAVWGAIAGTLSQQTDLQNALNAKADQSSTYTKTEVNNLLDGKQNELTFDNAPTENSNNPVKSGGIKTALDAKADTTSVYTKAEADALLANKADTDDLGDLATQDSVDFATQVTGKPSAFPPTEHNHDDRYYTETEVDTFVGDLQDQIDAINKFSIHICSSTEYDSATHIPTVTNPSENTFYLVPNGTGNDVYDEYIYTNNAWEKFGSARIDISQYYTKTQIDTLLDTKQNTLSFDTTPTANSNNPVTSGGVKTALDAKQNSLIFDTTPTANSTNPVQSGGIKTALDAKQNTLTFDTTPTANSNNPVKSRGILSAIGSAIANLHKIYSAITELGFAQSSYPKLKAVTNAMPEGSIGMFKQAEIDITDYDNYENIRNLVIFRNASHGIIVLGFSYFDDAHDMENYDYGLYYANYDPEWGYFQGFRKANRDPILYYENQSVYVGSNATIIRIPYGSSLDYNISPDTIVLNCTFANPSVITSNVTWRSYAGYILFTGTCTAATKANVTLGQKGN